MVNVVCVKYGTKYDSEYVNRLYRMVKKNLSLPFSFYCLTENPIGLHENIKHILLDLNLELESYWWKMCVFQNIYGNDDDTLYFDLDVVVQNNINSLFYYRDARFIRVAYTGIDQNLLEIHPVTLQPLKYRAGINTSIMVFKPSATYHLYNKFIKDPDFVILEYFGMCRYIWAEYNQILDFLYPRDNFYCFIKRMPSMYEPDYIPYKFKLRRKDDTGYIRAYHLPHCKIALLNGVSDYKFMQEAHEFFSNYYE